MSAAGVQQWCDNFFSANAQGAVFGTEAEAWPPTLVYDPERDGECNIKCRVWLGGVDTALNEDMLVIAEVHGTSTVFAKPIGERRFGRGG